MFCLNNMYIYFLRWLQSVKRYWKQTDSIIEKNIASKRNDGYHANFHKDYLQMKQSYKVRLGMFDIFIRSFILYFKIIPVIVCSFTWEFLLFIFSAPWR